MKPKLKVHHLLEILKEYPEDSLVSIQTWNDPNFDSGCINNGPTWKKADQVDVEKFENNTLYLWVYNDKDEVV